MTKTTIPLSTAQITAIGTYTPERILTNDELSLMVDTNDEWIVKRTGIRTRRIAAENEFTSDLIFSAIENMLSRYAVQLTDVDYIIVATSTPDTIFPSMAARVQAKFNITTCGAIDISAACAGFTAGIQLANSLLLSGVYKKILVIGADAMSKITDYSDRTTCILFGDGAGAIVMEPSSDSSGCLLASFSRTDGSGGHHVYLSQLSPTIDEFPLQTNGKLVQNGREVYRWAVTRVSSGIQQLLAESNYTIDDIDWFIPHSANMRIVEAILERTDIPREKALTSMEQYGNTSAASIPLALDEAIQQNRVKRGDHLLMYGFGGGLTEAAVFIRW